jgi:hypothetical protein
MVPPDGAAPSDVDWRQVARTAFGSAFVAGLIGGALHIVARVIEAEARSAAEKMRAAGAAAPRTEATDAPFAEDADGDGGADDNDEAAALEAALILGVRLDATEDQIRAALRARLRDSRIHPDQGGDGEEAKRLIAARNLLVERARARAVQP